MKIANRWHQDDGGISLKIPPPGRIVCTLGEKPESPKTCHELVSALQPILLQIAKFGHESSRFSPS
jgi:hypothetical protein